MSHELNDRNDMVYNALSGKPWHGLGVELPGLATAREVLDACPSFAAPVSKEQAMRNGEPVPDHYWTVRTDTDTVLGHVGKEYTVAQNSELLGVAEKFCRDKHGPLFETAGILYGGRKSWILAKFPDDMILKGRNGQADSIGQYLLFSNAHDGSQRLRVQLTPIRVVCNNTLTMAHAGKDRNTSAYICHSGDVTGKLANVADLLGVAAREFEQTKELYQALVNCEPTKEQIDTALSTLFPDTATERAKLQRGRVLELAQAGTGNAPFAGTAWGLYNGVTELKDHFDNAGSKLPDAQDRRVNSNWFGSSAKSKADALSTIATVCLN